MKRPLLVTIGLVIAPILLVWISLVIGVNSGITIGKAEYHNFFMRHIHAELSTLDAAIAQGNMEEIQRISTRLRALVSASPDEDKFIAILDTRPETERE